ncbi:7695_t:CDS:2, partial [Gigaspora rosea]
YETIRKRDMTIDKLYRKLLRIGRRANYRPEELRRKFLDTLPLPWLEKAENIGEHLPLASQQQGISLEDMQKAIQNALAQQKTEYQSLLKKQTTDFQSQMAKQTQPFQKPRPERLYLSNQNTRIDRIESKVDEIDDNKDDKGEYNEKENRWLLHLSQKKKQQCKKYVDLKEHCSAINPTTPIKLRKRSMSGSEFSAINDATIEALEWENDKQTDFAIKSDNSKYITKSLGWIIDVLVQGILDPNKNQFRMKIYGKTYDIPTFSKPPGVSEPEQQTSDMHDDNILQPIDTENQFQEIKNVIPIKSHNITIGRSEKLAIITLDASIVNDKYQTTPI